MSLTGFPASEYERRVRAFQSRMRSDGIAAALITGDANFNYLSGYHHFAPNTTYCRPVLMLVPTIDDPVLLVHNALLADASRDCWFDDVREYHSMTFAPIDEIVNICRERGVLGQAIGLESGQEHRLGLTLAETDALRKSLHPSTFVDVGEPLWDLRLIKSGAEVAHHREAARIATDAFSACFARLRAGMTELDASALLSASIGEQGGRVGFFIMTSGEGSYDRGAGLPRDRELRSGDFVWIDVGVIYRGYWSDHCRAGVIGQASAEQRDMWNAVCHLTGKAVQYVRPGITASNLADFIRREGEALDIDFSFAAGRSGHGMGLMSTEPPHIAQYDERELRTGMVFTLEPGWFNQRLGCFVSEENVVLREDGAELLTQTPRELINLS